MLRRSRVGSTLDTNRLAAAVSRPGIDPRVWCSLGYAAADSVLDQTHGHLLDAVLLPSRLEVTVRVPQSYAGKGFGKHDGLIHKDDEIVVILPEGSPSHGGVVVAKLWSASDSPPALAVSNPKDQVKVAEAGTSERFQIGDFTITIDNAASPTKAKVTGPAGDVIVLTKDGLELGVSPTDFVALATLVKNEITALRDTVNGWQSLIKDHVHASNGTPSLTLATLPAPAAVGSVSSAFVKSR